MHPWQVDKPGSRMHEAFIYNAAQGRLDVYAFDVWNMHQCQCGRVQTNMRYCTEGYVLFPQPIPLAVVLAAHNDHQMTKHV